MGSIRAFVAVPLSEAVISGIEAVQKELKAIRADVNWVRPASIHLTLKFLGNIPEEAVRDIFQAIQTGVGAARSWAAAIKDLGVFPSLHNPRVIWVGVSDPTGQLLSLQQGVEQELARLDFEPESRGFSPHLTLGRVRSSRGKTELIQFLAQEKTRMIGEMKVDRVVLFRSDLKPTGAVYTALKETVLPG